MPRPGAGVPVTDVDRRLERGYGNEISYGARIKAGSSLEAVRSAP